MSQIRIKNTDGDFFQSQNYVLQLVSEEKLSHTAFVLYCFYRSISGFDEIRCSYEWISINSGISKGSITNGNKILAELSLIKIINNGPNRCFEIEITPGSSLPRRQLKAIERIQISSSANERSVQQMNAESEQGSEAELINTEDKNSLYKDTTTAAPTPSIPTAVEVSKNPKYNTSMARNKIRVQDPKPYTKFLEEFSNYWCNQYNQNVYPKVDFEKVLEIEDPIDALKYIPVLWSLGETDEWVRNSDHSISIFVKEYTSGKLQSYYPKTKHYYKDKQEENANGN
jgi:hypothetical protein